MKILVFYLWFHFYRSCFAKLDTEWWKHTILYEMIPHTFKDSDGDGIGDFKGITSKLDHFVDLNIETIHLTPMFETTARDMGYDITDYYKVDHRVGTMSDLEELIKEMNKRNMKLVLDLVINHSGHKHEWFQKSIDRIDPYTDFYVWKDSKGFDNVTNQEIPPNKWTCLFAVVRKPGSGWTWNAKRKQFYFHQFLAEQPDFNLRNEDLKKELWKMIEFWLDKGVAGFRLDATPFFFEDKEFRDDNMFLRQLNQPETIEFIHEFRTYLDKYNEEHGGFERIFVAEAHAPNSIVVQYYGRENYTVTHFPYTFMFERFYWPLDAATLQFYLLFWSFFLPEGKISAWMTQDHDGGRVGSRIVPEYADIFTILSMMLPGTVGVYYGQEIAMMDGFATEDQFKDFSGRGARDPGRLLMQWDDSLNAGFSKNVTTYSPVNSDYFQRNVAVQKEQPVSHYNLFKDLSTLRKTNTFKFGKHENEAYFPNIFCLTRSYEGNVLAVVINFETKSAQVNLTQILQNRPNEITIVAASVNSGYEKGFDIKFESSEEFYMRPLSSVVLETDQP